jgi:hypothetical protein
MQVDAIGIKANKRINQKNEWVVNNGTNQERIFVRALLETQRRGG